MIDRRPSTDPWALHVRAVMRTYREPVQGKRLGEWTQARKVREGGWLWKRWE